MKILKTTVKIFRIIIITVLALLLAANTYMLVSRTVFHNNAPKIFGVSWAMVITGSMEPYIMPGDFVIMKEADSYSVSDVITFKSGNSLVTHRIIADTENGFVTKGDANNVEDKNLVEKHDIVGKLVFIVPLLGKIVGYLSTPLGLTALLFVAFLLIELPYILKKSKQQ